MPFVFMVPIVAAGIAGAGKTVKSVADNFEANRITDDANDRMGSAKQHLERSRQLCADSLSNLGEEKLFVLNNSIARFIRSFERIKNLRLSDSLGLEELKRLKIDKESMTELKEMQQFAAAVAGGWARESLAARSRHSAPSMRPWPLVPLPLGRQYLHSVVLRPPMPHLRFSEAVRSPQAGRAWQVA